MKKHLPIIVSGIVALAVLSALLIAPGLTWAQTNDPGNPPQNPAAVNVIAPGAIPIQGRLTDAAGKPLTGTYSMMFALYEAETGGLAICADDRDVAVVNGLFSDYMDHCYTYLTGQKVWLGITVGGDAEMTPRQPILPSTYALSLVPGVRMDTNKLNPFSVTTSSANGLALEGVASATTGVNYGVYGVSSSSAGYGGFFNNDSGGVGVLGLSVNGPGVSGASTKGAGVTANSTDGVGVSAVSTNGVAISAGGTGVIKSSAKSYVWVSGNSARIFNHTDTTTIDMDAAGGAWIRRGANTEYKNVILPITIPGQLYGQNIKVTALDIYWKGETSMEAITTVLLRRQTGVCNSCYASLLWITADVTCYSATYPNGCTQTYPITANNVLSDSTGILYLTLEMAFSGDSTFIELGGARLTLEHD